jgi:uncharacterized membrane protein YbhN (UPF0104 family)
VLATHTEEVDAPVVGDPASAEVIAAPTLSKRLHSRRTVISFALTVAVLGVAVWRAPIDWHATVADIRNANLWLFVAAVCAYYASMSLRTLRWQLLLRNTGEEHAFATLGQILMASFFVNCVVPAKMGDLYRGMQLRSRERAGGGNSFGTIIAERLIDLFTLMSLLVLAGAISFHNAIPRQLVPWFAGGLVLCAIGVGVLVLLTSGRGRRVLARLPEELVEHYERFRVGTIGAFGRWTEVGPLSLAIWGLEGVRLGLVIAALGLAGDVGPAHFLLVALVAALLTTVPFLPGGLGLVETGIVVVLSQTAEVNAHQAASIALLDRSISYGTLVLIGGIFFLLLHSRPSRARRALAAETTQS